MVPGLVGQSEMIVKEEDLVSRLGGIAADVLSTPRLVQLMEAAAIEAIEKFIPTDQLSVGILVSVKHLAPTPLGMKVVAHAILKEVNGNRLTFLVDAFDQTEKVADGEHERMLVPKVRFLEKVGQKTKSFSPPPVPDLKSEKV